MDSTTTKHPPSNEYSSQPLSPPPLRNTSKDTVPRSSYNNYTSPNNHNHNHNHYNHNSHSERSANKRLDSTDRIWSDPLPKQKFSTDYRIIPPSTSSSSSSRPNFQRYGASLGTEYISGKHPATTDTKRTATEERPVETPRKRWRQAWDTDLLDGRGVNETATTQLGKQETTEETRGNMETRDPRDVKNARVAAVNSLMESGATYEEAYSATRNMADGTRKFDPSTTEPGEIVGDEEDSVPFKSIDHRIYVMAKSYDMADAFLKKISDGMASSNSPYKSYDQPYRERGRSVAPRSRRNGSPYRSTSLGGSSRVKGDSRDQEKRRDKISSRDETSPVKSSYVGGRRGSSPGPTRKYSVDHRDTGHRRETVVYSVDHRAVKRYDPYMRDRRNSSTFDRNREIRKRSTSRGRSDVIGRVKERVPESDSEQNRRSRSRDGRRSPYDRSRDRAQGRDSNAARESERAGERNRDSSSSLQTRRNKDGHYEKDRGRITEDAHRHCDGNLDRVKVEDRTHREPYIKGEPEPDDRRHSETYDRATEKGASGDRNIDMSRDSIIREKLHRDSEMYYSTFPVDRVQQAPMATAVGELHSYRHSLDVPNPLELRPPLPPQQTQLSDQHFYSPSFYSQIAQQQGRTYQQIPAHPGYPMQTPLHYQTIAHSPVNNFEQQNLGIGNYRVLTPQNHLVPMQNPGMYVSTPNVMVNHPPPTQMMNHPGVVYMERPHSSDPNTMPTYQLMGSGQPLHCGSASTNLPIFHPNPVPNLPVPTESRSIRPTEFGWPMIEYVDSLMDRLRREIIPNPAQPQGVSSERGQALTIDTKMAHSNNTPVVGNLGPPTFFRPNNPVPDANSLSVHFNAQHFPSYSPSSSIPGLENLHIVDGTPTTRMDESSSGYPLTRSNEMEQDPSERQGKDTGTDAKSRSATPVKGVINGERIVYNETDWSVEELRAEHANYQC